MMQSFYPEHYRPVLGLYETQEAIAIIKEQFSQRLGEALNLKRVSAPLFVLPESGLNDDLSGVERPVSFDVPHGGMNCEIVQSLAKWKRHALALYDFRVGKGLYTDMNAIRRDEQLDNLHSVYVDQWDWELAIHPEQRTMAMLEDTVRRIVFALIGTQAALKARFPGLPSLITPDVVFISAQELEDLYPEASPEEREQLFGREHRCFFLTQIGGKLRSGKPHGGRAPDYDDWRLNGDLIVWSDVLEHAVELSSMGIRVDPEALDRQLVEAGATERRHLPFHRSLLNGELPAAIGGGIGQSRMCMLLLGKAHIGEVQSSVWDDATRSLFQSRGVTLL